MSEEDNTPEAGAADADQPQFLIQRVYLKDASFEAPDQLASFQGKWEPEVELNIGTEAKPKGEDHFEVVLTVTATIKSGDSTAYLVEIKQAGLFGIRGYSQEHTAGLLGTFCPSTLFPYAREAVSDLVSKAGFPQFILTPVNFDQLYQQHVEKQAAEQQATAEA